LQARPRGGEYGESVRLLRNLQRSLQLLVQARATIIEQLMRWPTTTAKRGGLGTMRGDILRCEDWYSNLASSNRRIADARERSRTKKRTFAH